MTVTPPKHKLCRWKETWSRDSQMEGSEVVHVLEQEGESKHPGASSGGPALKKHRPIMGNPDGYHRTVTPQPHPQPAPAQAAPPPQPAPAASFAGQNTVTQHPHEQELKKIRVVAIRRKRSREVLFIEAGKDMVDIIIGFLLLPGWAIIRLLKTDSRPFPSVVLSLAGCIENVYSSLREMDPSLLLVEKSSLLQGQGTLSCLFPALVYLTYGTGVDGAAPGPGHGHGPQPASVTAASGNCSSQRGTSSSSEIFIYGCHGRYVASGAYGPGHQPCPWIAFSPGTICPCCGSSMTKVYGQVGGAQVHGQQEKVGNVSSVHAPPAPAAPAAASLESSNTVGGAPLAGTVKEGVTFMVTDTLEIYPTSGVRSMELLNKRRWVIGDLEKVHLELGHVEVKKLMELSLGSPTALTETLCSLMR